MSVSTASKILLLQKMLSRDKTTDPTLVTKRIDYNRRYGISHRYPPFIYSFHCKNENVTVLEVLYNGKIGMRLKKSPNGFYPCYNIPTVILPYTSIEVKGFDSENKEVNNIQDDVEVEYFDIDNDTFDLLSRMISMPLCFSTDQGPVVLLEALVAICLKARGV